MTIIKCHDKEFVPFILRDEIETYIASVATQINKAYKETTTPPLFIGLLNGVYMFASDLMKKIDFSCEITFIKVSSYNGLKSSNHLSELMGLDQNIEGRDIIVLDEIVDTGYTIENVVKSLLKQNPKSIKIGTLIYKPNTFKASTKIDFIGHTMSENLFIVGYGLDYNNLGRNLPDIYILKDK